MAEVPDRIERSVDIDAPAERVYALISEPGWWINDGTALTTRALRREGELVVLSDGEHGEFRLRVGPLEPPRRAVFAWVPHSGGAEPDPGVGTTVEFRIEDREGGVRLTVVETGFASLDLADDRRRRNVDDNTEGWEIELGLVRDAVR